MHGVYERSVSSHSSRAYGEMKDWLRSGRGVHKTNTLLVWPGGTRSLVSEAVPTPQASCPHCSPELRNASNSFGGLSPSAAGRLLIDISHCSLEELLRELLMPQAVMDSPLHREVNEEMALLSPPHEDTTMAEPGEGTWRTSFSPSELLPTVAIILPMHPHVFFCYPENHTGDKHIHTWGKSEKVKFLRRIMNNAQGSVYFWGEPGFPHPPQMQVGNRVQQSLSSNIWSSVEVNKTQVKERDFHSSSRLLVKAIDTYKRQRQQPS